MTRSNRLVLTIGVFLAVVAFVLVIVLLTGGTSGHERTVQLQDGRVVTCIEYYKDLSCDWSNPR